MTYETPDPEALTPSTRAELTNVVFIKNEVTTDLIEAGDYTYYDNEGHRPPFEQANVKYLYGPQRLVLGRFTAVAPGAVFLMPAGNHPMVGPSTYPFTMFGGAWAEQTMETASAIGTAGDTVVGNDVWIGREATILPGVSIGDGAIIAANSVVTKPVSPYQIVGGNPARHIRMRYEPADIELLLALRWWDWPVEKITQHAATLMAGTPQQLREAAGTGSRQERA